MSTTERRRRVVIDEISPRVETADGLFPVKRTSGEALVVEADVFADAHERLRVVVQHRAADDREWCEVEMAALVNDRWRAEVVCGAPGRYAYRLVGWVDPFATWLERLAKRVAANDELGAELDIGARIVGSAAARARGEDRAALEGHAARLRAASGERAATEPDLAALMARYDARADATTSRELPLVVDRELARFSTWYELFPRSASTEDRAGTLADVRERLPLIRKMGFDVLYLPPIHPAGTTERRGPNNTPSTSADDLGSPWAIGSPDGGHDAVDPRLGTLADLRALVADARAQGIEVALDVAFQCSPDHPYVREHPRWFRHRPDGTIMFAENPPKKYRDIYPIDFETEDREALWNELLRVVRFWVDQGVTVFRVDNPHTKPFAFWQWLIAEVKRDHPDVIFLSEAFTRPKIMYRLAELGFAQSYTYFTWRNAKWELEQYFSELTQTPVREFFRPNLWPNTPDILHATLQLGGRAAFVQRFVLAATLGASYGIYGPAFELCEGRAIAAGSEEYLDSEKYQRRRWDWDEHAGIRDLVTRVNRVRREHPALQSDRTLRFHATEDEMIVAYSKRAGDDVILAVVSLDAHNPRAGFVRCDLDALGVAGGAPFEVRDLLTGARHEWRGDRNYVALSPALPAHVLAVRPARP